MHTHGDSTTPLLEARGVCKAFVSNSLFKKQRRVVAAEDVSFRINPAEAVALVGESGSGKSTVARLLLRLEHPDRGEILLDGTDVLIRERRGASLAYRGRVQMIFQDPFGSLNSVHTIAHHITRPLLRHRRCAPSEARARSLDLLSQVGLEPAGDFIDRHPYELSGGQRQRVAIARALAADPDVLVADEPTSMLDVSIRMDVLNLLLSLKKERRLAILLITHDLASARYLADRVLVLFRGRVVEEGPSDTLVRDPKHPYTRALLAAIADAAPFEPKTLVATQEPAPEPAGTGNETPDTGCPFALRCPEVHDLCRVTDPAPRRVGDRRVRCHLYPGTPEAGS